MKNTNKIQMENTLQRVGEVRNNNNGTPMKLIKYNGVRDIELEFQDTHKIRICTTYGNFHRGTVKNPYDRTVFNKGYLGIGKYDTGSTHNLTREYNTWLTMLARCYREGVYEAYKEAGCTVCEEWLNYQTFCEWYSDNIYDPMDGKRLHLDKDILIPGNNIYRPEACMLVPQRVNMLFTNKKNKTGLPNGIMKRQKFFIASYNTLKLGRFDTLEEAYEKYANEKEKHIKAVAEEYKGIVPEKVYEALINYKVNMDFDKNVT